MKKKKENKCKKCFVCLYGNGRASSRTSVKTADSIAHYLLNRLAQEQAKAIRAAEN